MRQFALGFLGLVFLSAVIAAGFYFFLDAPIYEAMSLGPYIAAALGLLWGFKRISSGPVSDKRFKSGFKGNETTADYAGTNASGWSLALASIVLGALVYFVSSGLAGVLNWSGTEAPSAGRLMTVAATREWVSSGPEWREAAWRASGCPEQVDESWVRDPDKRADFYRVIRSDVKLLCVSD